MLLHWPEMLKSVSLFLSQTLRAHRESTLFFLSIHNKHFKTINSFRVHKFFLILAFTFLIVTTFRMKFHLITTQLWANQNSLECSSLVMTRASTTFILCEQKTSHLTALLIAVVLKRILLGISSMTNKINIHDQIGTREKVWIIMKSG